MKIHYTIFLITCITQTHLQLHCMNEPYAYLATHTLTVRTFAQFDHLDENTQMHDGEFLVDRTLARRCGFIRNVLEDRPDTQTLDLTGVNAKQWQLLYKFLLTTANNPGTMTYSLKMAHHYKKLSTKKTIALIAAADFLDAKDILAAACNRVLHKAKTKKWGKQKYIDTFDAVPHLSDVIFHHSPEKPLLQSWLRYHETQVLYDFIEEPIGVVAWDHSGTRIATASNRLVLWNMLSQSALLRERLVIRPRHRCRAVTIAWSPDDTKVATAYEDGTVAIYDLQEEKIAIEWHDNRLTNISALTWNADGTQLITGSNASNFAITWNAQTGEPCTLLHAKMLQTDLEVQSNVDKRYYATFWSPDCTMVLIYTFDDHTARIWNTQTKTLISTLNWDAQTNHFIACSIIRKHPNPIVWSPNGKKIAIIHNSNLNSDHRVDIWDVVRGRFQLTLRGHSQAISQLVWSPDNIKVIATSSWNTEVWNTQTGCISARVSCSARVGAWNPSGTEFALSPLNDTQAVKLWAVQPCSYITLKQGLFLTALYDRRYAPSIIICEHCNPVYFSLSVPLRAAINRHATIVAQCRKCKAINS